MLINEKQDIQLNDYELFLQGVLYINSSQWFPAHRIFKYLTAGVNNASIPMLYNMALCCFHAKEFTQSIILINEALTRMSGQTGLSKMAGNLPEPLSAHEYETNAHLFALLESMVIMDTPLVKLRMRRLLIDANLELGNWDEVKRLSALPDMNKCKNVLNAISVASTKTSV